MRSNPLNRVIFRNKALDYFRFAIGPQNIESTPSQTRDFSAPRKLVAARTSVEYALVAARFKPAILTQSADRLPQTGFDHRDCRGRPH
jgi:hypothetical protein